MGSWGHVGSFSFQESKSISCGEGGICLTNNEEIKDRLYRSMHVGYGDGAKQGIFSAGPPEGLLVHNFRATEFQAVIAQSQLNNLDNLIDTYNRNAARLEEKLKDAPGLRVQSRGRLSTRQSYYAFCVIFDEAPLADTPFQILADACAAEGFGIGGTYGTVYNHILFNLQPEQYRVENGSCLVAETIGSKRTAVFAHPWLGSDEETIEQIGDVFLKVTHNAEALKEHTAKLSIGGE